MLRLPLLAAVVLLAISVALGLIGQAGAATTVVTAVGTSFQPQSVTVNVGDAVQWMGVTGSHTVTSSSPNWSINSSSDTSFTFTAPGTYTYFCQVHGPSMNGQVVVQGAGAATNTPTSTPLPTNSPTATATAGTGAS